jgi:RimJ/RimL family protein N-acetyltransferase
VHEERGKLVRLTQLRDEDSDRLFAWINNRALVVSSAPFRPVARPDHEAWFAAIRERDDVRIFGIRVIETDALIGTCQLHSIQPGWEAELQIRIGERHEQGRGYGREAVELLLRHAFGPLGLRRVTLHVFESNTPARAVYRQTGFREQTGPRTTVEIEGRAETVLRMAIDARSDARLVAIHQPNFFPWLGFFDKLRRCDAFVLLDTVEFSKGSRTNRSQVQVNGQPHWITAPVRRAGIGGPIRDVLTDENHPWRAKVVKTLRQSYARADAFDAAMPLLEELIGHREERLALYNEHAIRRLAGELAAPAEILRASELDVSGHATELLVNLVQAVGGTAYLAGAGARSYQENERFAAAGIDVVSQDFVPPEQVGGLSVIDAVLRFGADGIRDLLSRPARAALR